MQLKIDHRKFDDPAQMTRAWKLGQPADKASLDLRAILQAHLEATGATLRRKAACAAAVTLLVLVAEDEDLDQELTARLSEEAAAWATAWCGSPPLALRMGPIAPRHLGSQGRKGRPIPPGLAVEMLVAPVRAHLHRGGGSSCKVSIGMALDDLTRATLGPGSPSRHAEALGASWRTHLAVTLPHLAIAERVPTPRELHARIRSFEEVVAHVEGLGERHEALLAAQAEYEARVQTFGMFPEQVGKMLALIEEKVIFLKEGGGMGVREGHAWTPEVSSHYKHHKELYRAVLQNPFLSEGLRLALTMVQGEVERLWGHTPSTSANADRGPSKGAVAQGGAPAHDPVQPEDGCPADAERAAS